jgi:hypothetical protein
VSWYAPLVALHAIIAVVGVGLCGAIPLAARQDGPGAAHTSLLERLLGLNRLSLVAMFITGALLEAAAHGGYHEHWWFRLSVALLLVAGLSNARARAALRAGGDAQALARVRRWGFTLCAAVATITVLMEVKPF